MDKNMVHFTGDFGPFMWVLLFLAVLAIVLFIERTIYLHRGQINAESFLDGIKNLLHKRRLVEAITLCEETPSPVAAIAKAALLNFDSHSNEMQAQVQKSAMVELPPLEKRVGSLAFIAKIAPAVGLLGTLTAMLEGFYTYQSQGNYVGIEVFLSLVVQAILTTVIGLFIGILCQIGYHFLQGRLRAIVHDMEWCGNELMLMLLKNLPEEGQKTDSENPHFDEDTTTKK